MEKFATYEAARDAHPEHPIIVHAEYCLGLMAYQRNIDRCKSVALGYFNR